MNPKINACVELLEESAIRAATAADASQEAPRPLEGLPILVKVYPPPPFQPLWNLSSLNPSFTPQCNIDIAGSLSTASMPGLDGFRPQKTAPVVQKLIDAGAIPIAKTNMPEVHVTPDGNPNGAATWLTVSLSHMGGCIRSLGFLTPPWTDIEPE